MMLPAPIWPLAQHLSFGQNWSSVFISSYPLVSLLQHAGVGLYAVVETFEFEHKKAIKQMSFLPHGLGWLPQVARNTIFFVPTQPCAPRSVLLQVGSESCGSAQEEQD